MTSKEFNNEKLYQTTMSLMRSLLTQGTITQKEYCRIDTIFLEKYQPVFGKLYSDISLTFKPSGGLRSCKYRPRGAADKLPSTG